MMTMFPHGFSKPRSRQSVTPSFIMQESIEEFLLKIQGQVIEW